MAAHARLKNEFTEDKKYHNLMTWLIWERRVWRTSLRRTKSTIISWHDSYEKGALEEWVYGGQKVPLSHDMTHMRKAHLKNEFTEDKKYHYLMTWLIWERRVWRMSLRRTKSTIISWHDSYEKGLLPLRQLSEAWSRNVTLLYKYYLINI